MAKKGWVKKVFPGGNTYKGFHSFYDYIIDNDAARIFVIKGGPGVGKSSFMKHIAHEFVENGYDVELHHCSSDNNSLDGVVIPAARVALIDGTAPHVVDPKNPGAVDEILNLGEYWNEAGMVKNREEILRCNKEVKEMFNSSYHYLQSAKEMQDDIEIMAGEAFDRVGFNDLLLELKSELTGELEKTGEAVKVRHLFDSAITPDGVMDYIETVIPNSYKCYYVKSSYGVGSTEVIKALADDFALKGYTVELYHQPLNPEKLQTMVVKELQLALTVNPKLKNDAVEVIDLDKFINELKLSSRYEIIEKDRKTMELLMAEAVSRINTAKKKHDEMEKSYVPNMDFDAISELRGRVIERIWKILS